MALCLDYCGGELLWLSAAKQTFSSLFSNGSRAVEVRPPEEKAL